MEGWDVAFEIIDSVFMAKDTIAEEGRESSKPIGTRSSKLVRSAFGSLQLICSDFLASLPNSCFLILVDALYNFSSQDDDLNIALTVRLPANGKIGLHYANRKTDRYLFLDLI